MPFFVYVLESLRNGKKYTGHTGVLVFERLRQHNAGSNKWTKSNGPFRVLYYEEHPTKSAAAARERFLKTGAGRKIRDELIEKNQSVGD